jgi:hypothetical protein
VSIPGRGDLSPPHRHVPIGRWIIGVVVLLLLVGGGYAAFLGLSGGSAKPTAKLALCPPATKSPPALHKQPLRLAVLNGTQRVGLAAEVAADLKTRGYHVTAIGNTIAAVKGVATVRYSADRRYVADHVAAQVKGSKLVLAGGHGVVDLDLGSKFQALSSPSEAKQAYLTLVPTATPSASPTAVCQPRG